MREGQQDFMVKQGTFILENLELISQEINNVHSMCARLRILLDEGTSKLDSVLNIVKGVKTKEEEIMTAGGEQAVLQQLNEEQIDNLLEMLKTPTFQKLARQLLTRWINSEEK
ncbi:MAG: hypothetical protein ACOX2N_07790 [Peptococcia bacterium]|jgi:uncharacterized protein YacL (UPF0231 family)